MRASELTVNPKRRNALAKCKAVSVETFPANNDFALTIQIRGRSDFLHEEVCSGLEEAIRIGEKWFRAFQARNPWFVQDSKRRRIFILLDPESQSCSAFDASKRAWARYSIRGRYDCFTSLLYGLIIVITDRPSPYRLTLRGRSNGYVGEGGIRCCGVPMLNAGGALDDITLSNDPRRFAPLLIVANAFSDK